MKKRKLLPTILFAIISVASLLTGAGCAPSGYCVSFESNGGTAYRSVQTVDGAQEVILPIPEKPGFVFEGWYSDIGLTDRVQEEQFLPTEDTTLYAKWSPFEYTVIFQSNGGTVYGQVFASGQAVSLPIPQKENNVFEGWYESADFSGQALSGNYIASAQEVTLYAKWQPLTVYTVRFNSNGATDHEALKDVGEGVTLPVPVKYGYEFTGWYANEDCEGQAYLSTYSATEDITLYAGWQEVVYLYQYIADTNDYKRESYDPGTVVDLSELEIPENIFVNGVECEFAFWADENFNELTTVTLNGHTDIFAIFDESNAPVKDNFIPNSDGSYTSTYRNGVKVFLDEGKQRGGYSIDITFIKGAAGGVNATFRMKLSGQDYPYAEVGTEYFSAGFFPETGAMQIYRVRDGVLTNFIRRIYLEDLPISWQEKFNGAIKGELVTMTFTVLDFGDGFEVYVDGDIIYKWEDGSAVADYVGTGFGVRSSSPATKFANATYREFKTVTLQSNGGAYVADTVKYALGRLQAGVPLKENSVFSGWYYNQELTERVDVEHPVIDGDITLYAAYTEADINVTLYDGEMSIVSYGYGGGELFLPTLENKANRIFTGWYYDREATQPVDAQNPDIPVSKSLYAGYRLPKHDSFVKNDDGSYTISSGSPNGAFVVGETAYEFTEYKLNFTIEKGVAGESATLAFRMKMYQDNVVDGKSLYMTFGLAAATGKLGCGYSNGQGRFVSIKTVALSDVPQWSAVYGAGGTVDVQLSVKDFGSCVEYYINGELAYTLSDSSILSMFDGIGYGIRSSAKDVTYQPSIAEIRGYRLNLINGLEEMEYVYVEGAQLPTLTAQKNKVFDGWYYDSALTQAVDQEKHAFAENNTLYAGWRYPVPYKMTVNSDKTVSVSLGTVSFALLGEESYSYAEYTQEFSYLKGSCSGSVFIAFRADVYGDGACANAANIPHSDYLAFGVHIGNGRFGAGYVGGPNTAAGYKAFVYHTFANMPTAWQTYYSGVANGQLLTYKLVVRDCGTSVKAYLFWGADYGQSALVYECTDAKLASFTGTGYGIYTTALSVTDGSDSVTFGYPTVKELTETSSVLSAKQMTEEAVVKKSEEEEL